ncbi:MAG: hypothetical protein ACKO1M_12895 [Planctomycetota bacterium]
MSATHAINLSTAWEPPDPAAGREAWTRRFGVPAGLQAGARVWLVIDAATSCAAMLEGEQLPAVVAGGPWRHDVTGRLGPRNELALIPCCVLAPEDSAPPAHGRLALPAALGSVRLEIEPGAGGGG